MQSELKPCPFCGSDRLMVLPPTCDRDTPYSAADRAYPVVRCSGCYTDVPGKDFDASSKSAVEAWNRRSALVDVPAVEPVAWLPADDAPRGVYALIKHRSGLIDLCYKTDNGEPFLETWRYAGTAKRGEQAPWPESYIPVSDLRTSPPLSREGEDSAEVVEEGAKILAKWIGYAWDGLSDRDISAEYKDWAYSGSGALSMQGGKPALRKVAAAILALAATRSASATTQK